MVNTNAFQLEIKQSNEENNIFYLNFVRAKEGSQFARSSLGLIDTLTISLV